MTLKHSEIKGSNIYLHSILAFKGHFTLQRSPRKLKDPSQPSCLKSFAQTT